MSELMPKTHWVMLEGENEAPAPLVIGATRETREAVRAAARYAIRATTCNGTILDFDPDAMVQNFEVAIVGTGSRILERGL